jgi:hypothetical protein
VRIAWKGNFLVFISSFIFFIGNDVRYLILMLIVDNSEQL